MFGKTIIPFASFFAVLSVFALRVLLLVVPGRKLATSNSPFKPPRFILGHFRRGVETGIFQETHQLLKVLLDELINRKVRELIAYQSDPGDKSFLNVSFCSLTAVSAVSRTWLKA